jgi:hypothetical protein
MVCLLLLIGLGGIFDFVPIKTKKHASACKAPASASAAPLILGDVCG